MTTESSSSSCSCCNSFTNRIGNSRCYNNIKFSLKTSGYIVGWFGVILRTAALITLCVYLSKITKYDPNLFRVVLIVGISYISITLITNLALIIGIRKKKPILFMPHICIQGIEFLLSCVLFTAACILLGEVDWLIYFSILIPVGLIVIGILLGFMIVIIKLYNTDLSYD